MNEQFTNDLSDDEFIARKLNQVAEQTHVNSQFTAELEERLRSTHPPKTGWFTTFGQVPPVLRWVAVMILLALVLSLSIKSLIPAPQPAINETPINRNQVTATPTTNGTRETATPATQKEGGIDFRGAKLYMNAKLPDSPGQANVYNLINAQPATAKYAQALAKQLGIDGEVYITQGQYQDTTAYMVTDGKQQLVVNAESNYTYTYDMVKSSRNVYGFPNDNAETIIRQYLKAHALDFNFKFSSNTSFGGFYTLEQLTSDGTLLQSAYNGGPYMNVTLDEDGNILMLNSMLLNYDPTPLGEYRIISAEEALNRLLGQGTFAGEMESGSSPTSSYTDYTPPTFWYHDYPNDQTVTIYGQVTSNQAVDKTKPAMIFISNVPAIGKSDGMDHLNDFAFVQASGQFVVENGIRKFNVDTWEQTPLVNPMGSAHREGDQTVIDDGSGSKYILIDPPADLPLDTVSPESLIFTGAFLDGRYYWTSIEYVKDINSMGGGGGGGGNGFYKLNISGTPVAFPTATPIGNAYSPAELASFLRYTVQPGDTLEQIAKTYNVSVEDLKSVNGLTDSNISSGWQLTIPGVPGPTRLDGERGTVRIQIYQKPDGRQRAEYTFTGEQDPLNYEVTGDNLEPLQKVADLPIKIWGSLSIDQTGKTFLHLEKFEAIYPDLQVQTLKGTQETKEINGTRVSLFTTGGTTYVEFDASGGQPSSSYLDDTGGASMEAIPVPGETYAGYPAIRVIMLATGIDPNTGEPYDVASIPGGDEPLPDPYGDADSYIPPDTIIEKVELVYLATDSSQSNDQTGSPQQKHYVQPVWCFQGHTSDKGEIQILIQALNQEYLLPETEP